MSTTIPPPNSSVPIAVAPLNKNAPQPSTLVHHDNPDQRMANEAQHQANLMSEMSPLPHELLSEVECQKGKVPLAGGEHVDIQQVEAQHAPQVGHVVKEPNMFEKMGDAIKNVTSSQSSSSSYTTSTSTSGSIHPRDNIPHSALPNDTLSEIQKAKGSVPHAHHVDINKVEQQHQPTGLGHVQKEPNVLDKMGAALSKMTGSHSSSSSSAAASSTSTTTSGSEILPPHDNIPHSALPNDALREIHKAGGRVPHAHHVDISKVEQKVQPQGLGHVEKDKNILQRATEFLTQSVPPQRPDVPHSSLSTEVLKEVTAAKGSVPHAHHIDVEQVEKAHQVEPLGHVVEKSKGSNNNNNNNNNNKDDKPGLMQKIKDVFTSHSSNDSSSSSSTGKDSAQHAAVSDAVLNDIKKADIHNLHHVNVTDVEQRSALTNDMGHVVSTSEPVSSTTTITTTTTTTTEPAAVARFVPGSNVNPAL